MYFFSEFSWKALKSCADLTEVFEYKDFRSGGVGGLRYFQMERMNAVNEWYFWYKNNECVNTVH